MSPVRLAASLGMALIALVTLVLKILLERRQGAQMKKPPIRKMGGWSAHAAWEACCFAQVLCEEDEIIPSGQRLNPLATLM